MKEAGELTRRIQLQSNTPIIEGKNRTPDWSTFATVWACIEPLTGSELERARAFGATVNTRITIRYRTDTTHEHRGIYSTIIDEYRVLTHSYLFNAVIAPKEIHDDTVIYATEIIN